LEQGSFARGITSSVVIQESVQWARELAVVLSVSDGCQKGISTGGETSSVPVKELVCSARIVTEFKAPLCSGGVGKGTIIHAGSIKVQHFIRRALITTKSTRSRLNDIEGSSAGSIAGIVHHKIRCSSRTGEITEFPGIIGHII